MARIIDESFEGTGYEESWTEGGSGTINEDSTGPGTLPTGGGSQCLQTITNGTGNVYADRDLGSERATTYTRAYMYADAYASIPSGESLNVLSMRTGGSNTVVVGIYNNGTNHVWRLGYHIGAGWQYITDTTAINQDQWYRVEVKCAANGGNNDIEFRVDGTTIGSAANNVTLDRGRPQVWRIGQEFSNLGSGTVYIDLVAVDDTTWVGAEAGAAGQPTGSRYRGIPGLNLISSRFGRGW